MIEILFSLPLQLRLLVSTVAIPAIVLLVTYLNSLLYSWPRGRGQGREPPVAPYYLPGVQHLGAFLINPSRTFRSMQARYPDSPYTLLMGNVKFHVFESPSAASHVFARSRTFAYEPVTLSMLENGLNLPLVDRALFQVGLQRVTGKDGEENGNLPGFVVQNHNVWLRYLSGKPLDDVMQIFSVRFNQVLPEHVDMHTEDWQTVDLYELLRRTIFETSVFTFFGINLARIWGPEMWEDFCLFNDATYIGVRTNMAFALQPRAARARQRMLRAFEQWLEQDLPDEWPEADDMWNETWGGKMNWEREHLARQFGLSLRGRACLQASFLFAILLNAAPMATWFTWCAASKPDRLARYREEAVTFFQPRSAEGSFLKSSHRHVIHEMHIDAAGLKSNAFVQALWKEAARVGTAAAPARVVMEDTELEGYVLRQGSVVLMPTALLHHSTLFPNADQVVIERWAPDDPDLQKRQRSIRTFGGGMGMCSGRYAAEQEVIGTVSKLLLLFDIEFESSWAEEFHFNPRSLGIKHPAGRPMIRLKRRIQ